MNIIGCLDRPTRGTYRLAGTDVSTLSPDERAAIRNQQLGFVFQNFNLLPRTSAVENVELPLFYSDVPLREQHAARPRRARGRRPRRTRAEHRRASSPAASSSASPSRAPWSTSPSLLLADEPTGNLDTQTSDRDPGDLPAAQPRAGHHHRAGHARARHRDLRRARHHLPRRADRLRRAAGRRARERSGCAAAGAGSTP